MKNVFIYHMNEKNQIMMVEIYGSAPNIIDRAFLQYEGNETKIIHFSSGIPPSLRNVKLSIAENNVVQSVYNYGKFGNSAESYIYEGDVLVKINITAKEHQNTEYTTSELVFEYENDEVTRITKQFPNGYSREAYRL